MLGIIGLGLIGGSIAKAAKGYDQIVGFDTDPRVIEHATAQGVIGSGYTDYARVKECDLVVIALPLAAESALFDRCEFAPEQVVMDVCGVKTVMDAVPAQLDFVSAHPMAGKEVGGFENSDEKLFVGANFIMVGRESTSPKAMEAVRRLAQALGCGNIFEATRQEHDKMVAFTSQLPHALAACMVSLEQYQQCHGYEGGSLADFTRIAQMDSRMWSDLFLQNREELLGALKQLEQNIHKVQRCLAENDGEALQGFLSRASAYREAHE